MKLHPWLTQLFQKLRPLSGVAIFCLITFAFHKIWWWASPTFKATEWFQSAGAFMAGQVFDSAAWFLRHILGWDFITAYPNTFIFNDLPSAISHQAGYANFPSPEPGCTGCPSFFVNESCSGLKQFFQITVLFLLFPGPWKHKLWYIPASILIMHGVNIFRIIMLSVILVHWPQCWHFSHDWILRPFFYVVIFAEWVIWVNFSNHRLKAKMQGSRKDI